MIFTIFKIINKIKSEILLLIYKKKLRMLLFYPIVHPESNIGKRVVISKKSSVLHPIDIGAGTFY